MSPPREVQVRVNTREALAMAERFVGLINELQGLPDEAAEGTGPGIDTVLWAGLYALGVAMGQRGVVLLPEEPASKRLGPLLMGHEVGRKAALDAIARHAPGGNA